MKTKKLRELTIKELETKKVKLENDVRNLRFEVRIGQETDYSTVSKKKKELARINTLLKEERLGIWKPSTKVKKEKAEEKVEKSEDKKENKKSQTKLNNKKK